MLLQALSARRAEHAAAEQGHENHVAEQKRQREQCVRLYYFSASSAGSPIILFSCVQRAGPIVLFLCVQ
eukprot:SAG31_NODE_35247_length_325_cov_0.575221_1_plen_68_part_10